MKQIFTCLKLIALIIGLLPVCGGSINAQTALTSYTTTTVSTTASTVTPINGHISMGNTHIYSATNTYSAIFGTTYPTTATATTNVTGFVAGGNTYTPIGASVAKPFSAVTMKRVNNVAFTGNRFSGLFEYTSVRTAAGVANYNVAGTNNLTTYIKPSALYTMEDILNNYALSYGADNIFSNCGTGNAGSQFPGGSPGGATAYSTGNNIERVDLIYKPGIGATTATSLTRLGFLINERGGNDSYKVAAITSIDASGNVTGLGSVITVGTATWGAVGPAVSTVVLMGAEGSSSGMRMKELTGMATNTSGPPATQTVSGTFISLSNLGIAINTKVYGIAIFPGDITANFLTLAGTPTNTTDNGVGGLDLMSGNLLAKSTTNFDVLAQQLSGKIWNDINENGIDDGAGEANISGTNTASGGSIPAGSNLFVNIVVGGVVVAVVPVAADGTYIYNGMLPNTDYTLVLTNTAGTIGSPVSPSPPAGWKSTKDNQNGTVDPFTVGEVTFTSPFADDAVPNVINQDFGLIQTPLAVDDQQTGLALGSTAIVDVLSNDLTPSGNPLEPTTVSLSAASVSGATCTNTDAQGDCVAVSVPNQGTWTVNETTGVTTFAPLPSFTGDPTPIKYTVKDNTGVISNEATITLDYLQPACDAMTNGNFVSGQTSWTGWGASATTGWWVTSGRAEINQNTVSNVTLTQGVGGLSAGDLTLGITLGAQNVANVLSTITVRLNGVTYAVFTNPVGSAVISAAASNGATINGFSLTAGTGAFASNAFSITIPNYTGPSFANLQFLFSGGSDDFYIDDLTLSGVCPLSISGNVFQDSNSNTIIDATETPAITGVPMYVYLVASNGLIVDSAQVHSDGTYILDNVATNTNYTVQLSVTQYTIGSSPAINTTLPGFWQHTGENGSGNNTGAGDGTPNGILPISVGTANVQQQNFGVKSNLSPFSCSNVAYQVTSTGGPSSTLYSYNISTGARTSLATIGFFANSIGYSLVDNTIWGYDRTNNRVIQIDAVGATASYTIPNLPATPYNSGEVFNGYLLLYATTDARYYVVDINPARSTYLKLVDPTNGFVLATPTYGTLLSPGAVSVADFAYNPTTGLLYGVVVPDATVVANRFRLITINPITGATTLSSGLIDGDAFQTETVGYGSVFTDTDPRYIYVFANNLGRYYRINVSTLEAKQLSQSTAASNNDGAGCYLANFLIEVNGNVFNDANHNTRIDGGEGAASTGAPLYVYLVDNSGKIIDSATVKADGSYSLTNAAPNTNYTVQLSAVQYAIGTSPAINTAPPAGWLNTGENGTANNGNGDGTPNGILPVSVGNTDVSNQNFGLIQAPVAVNDQQTALAVGSTAVVNVLINDLTPSGNPLDPTTVSLSAASIPGATCTSTDAQGDCISVTVPNQGTWTVDPVTGQVSFAPLASFTGDPTPIGYTVKDNAGIVSNQATITLDYLQPVCDAIINGNFTGGQTGWTGWLTSATGWYVNSGVAQIDAGNNMTLTQAVGGLNTGDLTLGFTLGARSVLSTASSITVRLNGVTYAVFTNPSANNIITATSNNGATINGFSLTAVTGSFTSDALTITIPNYNGPSFANLQFLYTGGSDDYYIDDVSLTGSCPLSISGNVFTDVNDNTILDGGENPVNLGVPLYVYLVDNNGLIVDSAYVASDGTYLLDDAAYNSSYTLQLSTTQYAIGTSPAINTGLPAGWVHTGENGSGTNTGSGDGTPNGILAVITGGANIVQQNFGLSQSPVAVNDAVSGLTIGTTAIVNPLANDNSPSGSGLNPASVSLSSSSIPGSSCTKMDAQGDCIAVSVPGQGTWVVDSTTGITSFTPLLGYTGDPTPIGYTVRNNGGLVSNQATITIDYVQPVCSFITNGDFTSGQTGWTGWGTDVVTGWVVNAGRAEINASSNLTNVTLSQTLNGIGTGDLTMGMTLGAINDGGTTSVAVRLNGVTIATFNNPVGSQVITATPGSGVTINGFSLTAPASSYAEVSFTITITNYTGPSSAALQFVYNSGLDGFYIDNLSLTGNCAPTSNTITGNVLNDANGLTDNLVNGTGTNAGGMYVNLLNNAGYVVATTAVNADGTYSFANIPNGDYSVQMSSTQGTIGNPVAAQSLPAGWISTGEHLGTSAGSDGTVNGILPLGTVNSNVANANFGIEKLPVSYPQTQSIAIPTNGIIPAGTATTPITGLDEEDGSMSNSNTIVITALPANAIMLYNDIPVTAGQSITSFNPALLSFTGITNGSSAVTFPYAFIDAAGHQGTTANYTLSWQIALPIKLESFTGKALNCNTTEINWKISDAVNFDHFEVEKSFNGSSLQVLTSVRYDPAGSLSYAIKETNLPAGQYQYRLKMVDVDGKSKYSPVVFVRLDCNQQQILVYPNPVVNNITISGLKKDEVINLFSINGRLLFSKLSAGYQEQVDMSKYSAGTYKVVISNKDREQFIQ